MRNSALIDALYMPNDKLGLEMFGDKWNAVKGRVVGLTDAMIDRTYRPSGNVDYRYNNLFDALFVPDRKKMVELLGADAPIDFLPWDWARGISNVGSGITEGLSNIPFFSPWISAGRSLNQGMADILKKFGLSSYKESDSEVSTVQKVGLSAGAILLLVGAGVGIYYLTTKKRRRH